MRRPHPFHHEPQITKGKPPSISVTSSSYREQDRGSPQPPSPSPMASTNTPITSYFPQGLYDNALPVGKYYPSNYEARSHHSSLHGSKNTSFSGLHPSTYNPPTSEVDSDQKIRQYQRDIVAQAAMVLGSQAKAPGGITPKGLPVHELRFNLSHTNPQPPRLVPLGSPGPVTPMELESSSSGGHGSGTGRKEYPLSPMGKGAV